MEYPGFLYDFAHIEDRRPQRNEAVSGDIIEIRNATVRALPDAIFGGYGVGIGPPYFYQWRDTNGGPLRCGA